MSKQKTINVLITQPIESAKILRSIAENKGFKNRKQFIESLCENEVNKYLSKQLKLKL